MLLSEAFTAPPMSAVFPLKEHRLRTMLLPEASIVPPISAVFPLKEHP